MLFRSAAMLNLGSWLIERHRKTFPPSKIEQGLAFVEDVEEILVCDNIFRDSQLVFCEHIPPQVDYYLVDLVFKKEHYQIRSHQLYAKNTEVGIEYVKKFWGIVILRILKNH